LSVDEFLLVYSLVLGLKLPVILESLSFDYYLK